MKKALVLGGTADHYDLIIKLKKRGYKVILIDYHDNPPAKKVADEYIKESILNQKEVLRIAQKKKINLIITACIDQALVTACYVAEKLALPAPFSFKTALMVTNKVLMKKKC
jgi:formate-dependent phosphoribosylglycinamide formyltransferase (GAR transformylase)